MKPVRQKWFGCACCPPNLARLLASLGAYAYTSNEDSFYLHLYMAGEVQTRMDGRDFRMQVDSGFPWHGQVKLTVQTAGRARLALRLPGWCRQHQFRLNGEALQPEVQDGYAVFHREWQPGDVIEADFAMPVTLMAAHPRVREDAGMLAVTRGPIVYCVEEKDNGSQLHRLRLNPKAAFTERYEEGLLGGVMALTTMGERLVEEWPEGQLYRPADAEQYEPQELRFIPYYAWANRGEGEMRVWLRRLGD